MAGLDNNTTQSLLLLIEQAYLTQFSGGQKNNKSRHHRHFSLGNHFQRAIHRNAPLNLNELFIIHRPGRGSHNGVNNQPAIEFVAAILVKIDCGLTAFVECIPCSPCEMRLFFQLCTMRAAAVEGSAVNSEPLYYLEDMQQTMKQFIAQSSCESQLRLVHVREC